MKKLILTLKKSVNTLTELEVADDIMNSLYNMALNYFVAEAYESAKKVVEVIIKMLKELGYSSLRACSNTKLYSIIAISCYYQKEYYNSYYFLSKMEVIVEHILKALQESENGVWDEDMQFYHLLKAMLYSHEEKLELADKEFSDVYNYMQTASGSRFCVFPIYLIERSELYKKLGMKDESDKLLRDGIEYLRKEGQIRKEERIRYYAENGERQTEPIIVGYEVDLPEAHIYQVAKHTGTQIKLKKKKDDIKFLTVLQEAISRENLTVNTLFQNTSAVLKNSYNLNDIIILRRKDGKLSVLHEGDVRLDDMKKIDGIFNFFKEYRQAILTNRTDKNFVQFTPVMQLFDVERIMTMIGIPIVEQSGTETIFLAYLRIKKRTVGARTYMSDDDLMILKFAFSQFCEMMRRIDSRLMIEKMNHRLEQSAITDHLTGIINRSGFSKQIEIICSQDKDSENVILYLDLDNFKYYNDTFGHEIGDLVLVCFAEMFKKMTKGKGLAVRYGGDEFIILLYDQSERGGAALAEQIYHEIRDGFRDEISVKLHKKIDIPEEKKISCSIGIASFHGGSKDAFELALNHADQMLYYVKRNGKSKYKLFSEYKGE